MQSITVSQDGCDVRISGLVKDQDGDIQWDSFMQENAHAIKDVVTTDNEIDGTVTITISHTNEEYAAELLAVVITSLQESGAVMEHDPNLN